MLVSVSIRDVMTDAVETVSPDATARAIAEHMDRAAVGSVVVVEGGEPVGVVTDSDLVGLLSRDADVDSVRASAFMSGDPVVVDPDEPVGHAAELLDEHGIGRLPVVDAGELVGIVTATDLSDYLPRLLHERPPATDVEPTYAVRPDTAYEKDDWEFECRCVSEGGPAVGDVVEFSKRLTDEDVRRFADASGDTNRLHLEEEYAAGTRFGRRIVHGTLVNGVVSAALARLPGLTIYLSQETSYLGPVDVGDRVRAVCEIVEDLGGEKYRLATEVHAGDERVTEGQAVVLVDELPEAASVEIEQVA